MSAIEIDPPQGRPGHPDASPARGDGRRPSLVEVPPAGEPIGDHSDLFTVCAEEVHVPERLIAAPAAGVFRTAPPEVVTAEGEIVQAGQVVGTIELTDGAVSVTSAHTGFLMGLLALPGERVRADQPLAWVRVVA
jgi:biotin carboxyl carrier protein